MSLCKTSPAPTPLQLSVRGGLTTAHWMHSLSTLESRLASADSEYRTLVSVNGRIAVEPHALMGDDQLTVDAPAAEVVQLLLRQQAKLAGALALANRQIGRAEFQRLFDPGSGRHMPKS
jgi:hypothetical protein